MFSGINDEPTTGLTRDFSADGVDVTTSSPAERKCANGSKGVKVARERNEKSLDRLRSSFTLYKKIYGGDAAREALMGIASIEFRSRRKAELVGYVASIESSHNNMCESKPISSDRSTSSNNNSPTGAKYLSYRRSLGTSMSSTATPGTSSSPLSTSASSDTTDSLITSCCSLDSTLSKSSTTQMETFGTGSSPRNLLFHEEDDMESDDNVDVARFVSSDGTSLHPLQKKQLTDSTELIESNRDHQNSIETLNSTGVINEQLSMSTKLQYQDDSVNADQTDDNVDVARFVSSDGTSLHPLQEKQTDSTELIESNRDHQNSIESLNSTRVINEQLSMSTKLQYQDDSVNADQTASSQNFELNALTPDSDSESEVLRHTNRSSSNNTLNDNVLVEEELDRYERTLVASLNAADIEGLSEMPTSISSGNFKNASKGSDDALILPLTNSTAASTTSQSACSATPSLAAESNVSLSPVSNVEKVVFIQFPDLPSFGAGKVSENAGDPNSAIGNVFFPIDNEVSIVHTANQYVLECQPSSFRSSIRQTQSFISTSSDSNEVEGKSSSSRSSIRQAKSFASTSSASIEASVKERWMASYSVSSKDSSSTEEDVSFFAGSDPSYVPSLKSSVSSGSFFIKDSLSGKCPNESAHNEIQKIGKKIDTIDVIAWNTVDKAVGIIERIQRPQKKPKKAPIKHCGITSSSSSPSPFNVDFMTGYLDYVHEKGSGSRR